MAGIDISKAFNNNGLFSNHYLESMIQGVPEWNDDTRIHEVYLEIKEILYRKGKNFDRYVEADLEHNWIRPVLDILGHHYGVQEGLHHDPLKPDYAFFPDQQTLEDAYSHKKDAEDFYKKAVAIGDAKAWNILLDKSRQGKARRDMTNPSFQIDVYLRATPPKWAILTNGRLWRLYHEDTSVKMDCYYEVNLPELINKIEETGDNTIFKYFYLFFRLEAFPQVPLGSSFLDRIREESIIYAQKIGKDLQENVYKAMKVLAEGFFAEQSNALSHLEEDIRDVQENSLRLLYRLLFIFYAESRKLLNTDNKYYREMSLRKLKEEIAAKIDREETLLAVRSTYWEGLKDLFKLINDGSESFGYPKEEFYIPAYNGGLFDPTKNPFLAQKKIGNSYLAKAIDLLARSKGKDGMAFVDYSSLQIQHLGSIYEGLLEYKIHLADEPMVAIKEKGKEVWLPKREAIGKKILDSIEAGSLYLVTDKGERKATGSFYTPEYIVEYIVKSTLAPLIDPLIEEAMWSDELRKDLLKKLLSLKVLDPAMGSGHFLVEATDYIAREIIHAKEIARREDMESEEVAENDIHWARREVVRNCIYGVDLNPMAVELAKLSLWLKTVASNKPLSFLDHHLRCGNSLIGADLDKLLALPGSKSGQPPLWKFVLKQHTDNLLNKYNLIASLPDDSLQMVKWKEERYKEIQEGELGQRLRELANVWISTYFGDEVSDDEYEDLLNHLSPDKFPEWAGFREKEWFQEAQQLAQEKRFFHWELEFPEAFHVENQGFDAVIGNPPYVRQERLGEDKRYFQNIFQSYHGIADLYVYFFEQGHEVLKNKGKFGFISSNKFMRSNYGMPLRNYLLSKVNIKQIIDFGELPVFSEASTFPAIFLTEKVMKESSIIYVPINNLDFKSLEKVVAQKGLQLTIDAFEGNNWTLCANQENIIMKKMDALSITLGTYTNGKIYWGIKTGLNDAFIIDDSTRKKLIEEDTRNEAIIKPILIGDDIRKYGFKFRKTYLIYIPWHFPLHKDPSINGASEAAEESLKRQFPSIYQHLLAYKDKLAKRNVAETGIRYEWYALQRFASDYYSEFAKPKIIYPEIAKESRFAADFEGKYLLNNKCFFIPLFDYFLLSVLNSKITFFYILRVCSILGDPAKSGRAELRSVHIQHLPIRRILFTTSYTDRSHLMNELQQLYESSNFDEVLAEVESCLPRDATGSFIAEQEKSDVVHDLLAFLAEQMLEMNKQKQKEINGFISWLEGELGSKVEDLTPKTKIQAYYDLEFGEFHAILKKNKKKLKIDPSKRDSVELLRSEFYASLDKLKPLMEKIKLTDELIDQIVYRLYGLTGEEIKIVEGNTNA